MPEHDQNQYTDDINFDGVKLQPPGKQKNNKIWMGCCGGCLGIVIIGIIGIFIGTHMLLRSEPVSPHELFLLPDADGFLVVQIAPEDEGLVDLLTALAQRPPAGIDMTEEEKETLIREADEIPQRLAQWTPVHCVSLLYHLPEPELVKPEELDLVHIDEGLSDSIQSLLTGRSEKRRFHKGLIGSISRAGALMRLITRLAIGELEKKGGMIEDYRETRIAVSPAGGFAVSAIENNFFLANRTEIIKDWIDILKDIEEEENVPYSGPSHLKEMYRHIDPESLLYFVFSNQKGELRSAKESLLDMPALENEALSHLMPSSEKIDLIDSLSGSFHILSREKAELDLFVKSKHKENAQLIGDIIERTLLDWHNILLTKDIAQNEIENIEIKRKTEGQLVHVRLEYREFEELIRQIIQ